MTQRVTDKDITILDAVFDYMEIEGQYECGLPVPKSAMHAAFQKICEAASEVYSENEGERPNYG